MVVIVVVMIVVTVDFASDGWVIDGFGGGVSGVDAIYQHIS